MSLNILEAKITRSYGVDVEIDSSYSVTRNANFVTVMTLLRSFLLW